MCTFFTFIYRYIFAFKIHWNLCNYGIIRRLHKGIFTHFHRFTTNSTIHNSLLLSSFIFLFLKPFLRSKVSTFG